MTELLARLFALGLAGTAGLALCVLAAHRLDAATVPAAARPRLRWCARHATPALTLATTLTVACGAAVLLR